jgi:hypothetical protein
MSLKGQEIRTVSASPRGLGEPCTAWRLFLSAWVVLLLLGQAVSARAADGDNSLWASPASLDLTVRAGQAISQEFQVGNDSDVEVKIKAYVWDWWLTDKNKKLFGPPGSSPAPSMARWATFTPSEALVKPHSVATFRMFLSVPSDAAGGYYGVAFFEGTSPELTTQGPGQPRILISIRLGTLIMLAIDNTQHYQLEVGKTQVAQSAEHHELTYSMQLANRSNVHLMVQGVLAIFSKDHRLIGKTRIEPERLLPNQRDTVAMQYTANLGPGQYTAVATLIYGKDQSLVDEQTFTVK